MDDKKETTVERNNTGAEEQIAASRGSSWVLIWMGIVLFLVGSFIYIGDIDGGSLMLIGGLYWYVGGLLDMCERKCKEDETEKKNAITIWMLRCLIIGVVLLGVGSFRFEKHAKEELGIVDLDGCGFTGIH
jgi:uncharacterized oligopeptide transporter (OPT) family protein